MTYNFNALEKKWQNYWAEQQTFAADNASDKEKYYVLDMFPYPSGAGLHVGHPLGYIASDIVARFKRHQGFNVLHPQGYDSFGLPAEQYAIQTGQHPAITTRNNVKRYREQLDKIGFSFDWSREVKTSDPQYYKWTQWIFLQLFDSWYDNKQDKARSIDELKEIFKAEGNRDVSAVTDSDTPLFSATDWTDFSHEEQQKHLLHYRLTYLAETEVNWCPALGTVLANDEIVNGVSERGGHPVKRRKMKQWSMRISAYADRLLSGLDKLDWTDSLKELQRNWIGKSVGASVNFKVLNSQADSKATGDSISVFTTRPDTIFGASFMTLAPEHPLVSTITTAEQKEEVDAYIETTAKRSERERMAEVKNITGVFTGAYAEHPFTKAPIPIWIGDYVLADYGTGAVMSVPCGDQRDYDFAKHFGIPIKNIFEDADISEQAYSEKENTRIKDSDFLNGLSSEEAIKKSIQELGNIEAGKAEVNFRLRDAVFSRQRYWGEPFPIYYDNGIPHPIGTEHLPLELPEVEKYLPTEDGAPPLGRADQWAWDVEKAKVVSNNRIDEKSVFPLELNTMPGWAGSSWYFLRYMEKSQRSDCFASEKAMNYWKDVDLYIGGSEHATGHLLYARFWTKFLQDRGFVPVDEPFKKLINQGMILGESAFVYRLEGENTFVTASKIEDKNVQAIHAPVAMVNTSYELDIEAFKNWRPEFKEAEFITDENDKYTVGREVEKMSKSKYNVVNPDDICREFGADTLRMYEMFLGPLDQAKPWSTAGITGVHNFLKKLWKLYHQGGDFNVTSDKADKSSLKSLHKTIQKVTEDIEEFSFNTSVSSFMICVNELNAQKCKSREVLEPLAVLIAPYAPHIAEELWEKLGHNESISTAQYPVFEEKHIKDESKTYPISFNGKKRFTLELSVDLSKDDIEKIVMDDERTQEKLDGESPKKVIIVPGKIVNIVL